MLQRIGEEGKLLQRYVEPEVGATGEEVPYFEECGCVQSPVVAGDHVYVHGEGGIYEIPYNFESTAAPTEVLQRFTEVELGGGLPFINFPAPSAEDGAGLAVGKKGRSTPWRRSRSSRKVSAKTAASIIQGRSPSLPAWSRKGMQPARANPPVAESASWKLRRRP